MTGIDQHEEMLPSQKLQILWTKFSFEPTPALLRTLGASCSHYDHCLCHSNRMPYAGELGDRKMHVVDFSASVAISFGAVTR